MYSNVCQLGSDMTEEFPTFLAALFSKIELELVCNELVRWRKRRKS